MSTMMESIALNEDSHVVEEELDYVLVKDDAMEVDDDERDDDYDYCDDLFRCSSPIPSSSFSFCSNSFDNVDALMEEMESSTVVSLDVDIDDITLERLEEEMDLPDGMMGETRTTSGQSTPGKSSSSPLTSRGASRLSNKKRRKKMKLMKKAAAATAAAAALASGATSPTRSARLVPSKPKNHHSKKTTPKRSSTTTSKKKVSNVAVACATASLQKFRRDHSIIM